MATLRERITTALEERTGLSIVPGEKLNLLETTAEQFRQFRNEASELAYWTLDYFGGRPQEMRAESRKRLAQRSRIAFLHDPLAGAEAALLANFAFGQGVGKPDAVDEKVQQIIDRAWNDANNVEMFTGYAAQRRSSNSLLTQGELFDLLYSRGGKIRVGKLDPDFVQDIVPDPEFRLRPLYYIGQRRTFRWDVDNDRPEFNIQSEGGRPKVTYYPHWRNVDDAARERDGQFGGALEPLPVIPEDKRDPGKGVVYHTAINQLDEQLRGNPPWARSIRFYSAMNEFTEARVAMAQAASQFIATNTLTGQSQTEMVRSAGQLLSQTGELGTQRFVTEEREELGAPLPRGPYVGAQAPGSWWLQNDKGKLEPLNLNSGSAAAAADAQIIRAPLAAASQFGQHYLGDASNANLATATSLELPTLMAVLAWQQTFHDRFKWFVDRAIEAAVHAGELGGVALPSDAETDGRTLSELRLSEGSTDKAEMESRTGVDLTYSFSMPYPGRRNLPDVTASIQGVLGLGNGLLLENEAMTQQALLFLFTHGWQLDDPQQAVDQVMKDWKAQIAEQKKIAAQVAAQTQANLPPGAGGELPGGGTGAPGGRSGPSSVGDAPAGATPPKNEMGAVAEAAWLPEELRKVVADHSASTADLFAQLVELPAVLAAKAVTPNGSEPVAA